MTATYSAKLKPNELEPRKIASSINRIIEGRTDNYGSVTLTANTTTTTVTNQWASENSTIVLSPRSANAAAELGAGTAYISTKSNGSFVITHANNAQTDRTFDYAMIG